MHVLYFAYGSCMSPEDLARDVAEFELVGPALVRGDRLGFTRYSRTRRGGVADLVPDMAGVVEGVLYRLPVEQSAALDEREGAPDNYRRDFIAVRTPDGRMYDRVLTYVVADKAAEEIPPHPDYVATILSGATAYLSPAYVEQISAHVEQLMAKKAAKEQRKQDGGAKQSWRGQRTTMESEGRETATSLHWPLRTWRFVASCFGRVFTLYEPNARGHDGGGHLFAVIILSHQRSIDKDW